MIRSTLGIITIQSGYDPDAQLFFTAEASAGVTLTSTQMSAVNKLVVDFKSAGIWTKMKALYPMVGGTSTSHKFNLKNPLDTNAAFRLTFGGGWSHSSTGALSNGSNGYAETYLNIQAQMTLFDMHMSYYSNVSTVDTQFKYSMGCFVTPYQTNTTAISVSYSGGSYSYYTFIQGANSGTDGAGTPTSFPNRTGLILASRLNSTPSTLGIWKDGTKYGTATTNTGSPAKPNFTIWFGCVHNQQQPDPSAPYFPTSLSYSFVSIGSGLTDTEAVNFRNAVQTYQTTLGRQV